MCVYKSTNHLLAIDVGLKQAGIQRMRSDFRLNETKWGVVLISSSSRRRNRNLRGQSRSCCWEKLVGSKHVVFSREWTNQIMLIRQRHKTLRRRHHQLSLLRVISRRTETAHSIHHVALIFQALSCLYFLMKHKVTKTMKRSCSTNLYPVQLRGERDNEKIEWFGLGLSFEGMIVNKINQNVLDEKNIFILKITNLGIRPIYRFFFLSCQCPWDTLA